MKNFKLHGNQQPGSRSSGYSLIEVMIAFVVRARGVTSIVSFQGRLTYESNHAKARTEAANIGQKKMEELRNYTSLTAFDALITGSDTVGPTGSGADLIVANLSNTFSRSWTIATTATSKTVAMQVTWPDRNGSVSSNTTVNLNTVMARVDPEDPVLTVPGTTSTTTTSSGATTTTTTTTTAMATTTTTSTTTGAATTTAATTTSTTATSSTTTTTTTTTAELTLTISGTFDIIEPGVNVTDVQVNGSTCGAFNDSSYICTVTTSGGTWSGTVTVSSNKTVCGSSSTSYAAIAASQVTHYRIRKFASGC